MSSQGTASGTSRLRSPWTWALFTLVLAGAMTFLSLWDVPGDYAPDSADPDNLQTQFTHTEWVLASASAVLALPIALVLRRDRRAGRIALSLTPSPDTESDAESDAEVDVAD
jgi:hypothetical protein